jgi:hypothetical protein
VIGVLALLLASSTASAQEDDPLRTEVHGYYRARYLSLHDVFGDEGGHANFLVQRLRFEPAITYGPDADAPIGAVRTQVDALDDVVWGDNSGLARTPLFATDLSSTGRDGVDRPSVVVKRAWLELQIPIGQLRVGRMGSNWGLGLLANSGDGFDDDFGDNRFGTTNDRILFATRPWMIVQALRGRPLRSHPLLFAIAYDELVEAPGDPEAPRGDLHQGWLANGKDDVPELVLVLLWKDDEWHRWRTGDQVHAGVYYVHRTQANTDSSVHVIDLYGRVRWGPWFGAFEGYQILGRTEAIAIGDPGDRDKTAEIIGAALRGGFERPRYTLQLEAGHASGDPDFGDKVFSGRSFHPDYHVGLVLFQEVLPEMAARRWGEAETRGLWPSGSVYNATYGMLTGKLRPLAGLDLLLAGLYAVPDEADLTIVRCDRPDAVREVCLDSGVDAYGFEVDAAVKVRFQQHFDWTLEGGVLFPGEALWTDDEIDGGYGDTTPWTLQTRIAMIF